MHCNISDSKIITLSFDSNYFHHFTPLNKKEKFNSTKILYSFVSILMILGSVWIVKLVYEKITNQDLIFVS